MKFYLIVLEGTDCCGKTTVSKLLQQKLSPSIRMAFPDRTTEIGDLLDRFLKKKLVLTPIETHLLYSANRYEKASFIKKTLETSHIICDRYWLSGTVYSTAKGLDYNWCKIVDEKLPKADYTFFIDVDPKVTSERSTFGPEAHDKIEFQTEVYRIYKEKLKEEGVISIESGKTPEEIAESILSYLN